MLDKALEFGASFDWISPVASILGNIINGPSHTFLIPYDQCPLSGRDVALMLKERGVQSWGLMVVSGTFMISVRLSQAPWAQHLLEQAGVPIENPVPAQRRKRAASGRRASNKGQTRRTRKSKRRSELGGIADSVSQILNTRLF